MKSASNQVRSMGQKVLCKTASQPGIHGVGADRRGDRLPLPEPRSSLGTWEDVASRGAGDQGLQMYSSSGRSSPVQGASREQGAQSQKAHGATGPFQIKSAVGSRQLLRRSPEHPENSCLLLLLISLPSSPFQTWRISLTESLTGYI